jgi:hypothetical protein
LDKKLYSRAENTIILKKITFQPIWARQINKTQAYIEFLKRFNEPIGLIEEYEKTILQLKIAQKYIR